MKCKMTMKKMMMALVIGGLTLQGSPAVVNAAAQHADTTTVMSQQNQSTNEAILHMHQR